MRQFQVLTLLQAPQEKTYLNTSFLTGGVLTSPYSQTKGLSSLSIPFYIISDILCLNFELLRWLARDQGQALPPEQQAELDTLVEAELRAATARTATLIQQESL
ncbi:MAG: hypothetical protein V7K67_04965 [Nostoc sp.]|uniref:hypothetical protein n=1 Tax=Nostoc sp. TaxID=1180 RepID=UPI002FEFB298